MLQKSLELIVQYPTEDGYSCRGFRGVFAPQGVFIAFDGILKEDQAAANTLGSAFCDHVRQWLGVQEDHEMPCGGMLCDVGCHAFGEVACRKLLVGVADSDRRPRVSSYPDPTALDRWPNTVPSGSFDVLPVIPVHSSVEQTVPAIWHHINVAFWRSSPSEAVASVCQRAGLAPFERRVFISYFRRETTPLAEQLFTKLTESGFDVFLDRFSVPAGVNFQEQLHQDLCDKSMMVLLNSPGISTSSWVEEEIAIVKRFRLGLFELVLPGGAAREDVDPDFQCDISAGELTAEGAMLQDKMDDVLAKIHEVHGLALHRRRYELADNFAAALVQAGRLAHAQGDGTFIVQRQTGGSGDSIVSLTPRPPELSDFCILHTRSGIGPSRLGWLISPAPNVLVRRQAEVSWLGGVSQITHIDESQLADLAATIP